MTDISDDSLIAVALLLLARDERDKARRHAMKDLEMIDSMSKSSRGICALINTVFPSDTKAGMVSEFFRLLAIEFEKDRPQAVKSYVNTFLYS